METREIWKKLFESWPAGIPRRGVLVANFDEQVPFSGFMIAEDMVLLERQNPDTLGARKLFIPYDNIACVKLIDPMKSDVFVPLGFKGVLEKS